MYVTDEIHETLARTIQKHEKARDLAILSEDTLEQAKEESAILALKSLFSLFPYSEDDEEEE